MKYIIYFIIFGWIRYVCYAISMNQCHSVVKLIHYSYRWRNLKVNSILYYVD